VRGAEGPVQLREEGGWPAKRQSTAQHLPFLERLTKPCHRQARGMRLTSDGTNQKQRNQRGAVQEDCAIAARDDTFSQGRAATVEVHKVR